MDPSQFFLGPAGENAAWLTDLLARAVRAHADLRASLHAGAPARVAPPRPGERADLERGLGELLTRLAGGTPFFAERYAGHMNSDVLLPAVVGYVAAMLGNPNNVAHEGGPATTALERECVARLARMLGFTPAGGNATGGAWGHLTSGGTLANIEALWVARNVKYLPLAAQRVAQLLGVNVPVRLADGRERRLVEPALDPDLDRWQLLNLDAAESLAVARGLAEASTDGRAARALARDAGPLVSGLFGTRPAVVLVPATRHYSWDKAADVLGLGRHRVVPVPVDARMRMDPTALAVRLNACRAARVPVLAVACAVGSTEEGAVDPLDLVAEMRERYAREADPLSFWLHADAAYGGYLRALCVDEAGAEIPAASVREHTGWPAERVHAALGAMGRADSATVDPHKLGYVPYGAGAVVFRDAGVREILRVVAPYAFPGEAGADPSLGQYTLEGSRPGASAAAVWLATTLVPLHANGHGALLREPLREAARLYRLLREAPCVGEPGRRARVVPLTEPDAGIVCFAVVDPDRPSLSRAGALTRAVAERVAVGRAGGDAWPRVSRTALELEAFGSALEPMLRAMGVRERDAAGVELIRVVMMHPWSERGRTAERLMEGVLRAAAAG